MFSLAVWLIELILFGLMFSLHDWNVVKGIFFAQILIAAGYQDALTHLIPNEFCIAIFLDGLILCNPIPSMFGFFTVSLPLLLIALILKHGVGGGDIKLLAVCGFVLGPAGIVHATVTGSVFFFVYILWQRVIRKPVKKMYAMAPFYAVGCCTAYLMKG